MRPPRQQRGFTLVELMVTVGIALFLLGGLVTIVQNVRETSLNQQRLAQLQDEQRFAWTVITDAVQAGGYFSDPINYTTATFAIAGNPAPTAAFQAGYVFAGSHVTGAIDKVALDSLATRFQTNQSYGPILCDGTDTAQNPPGPLTYSIQFSLSGPPTNQLICRVNGGPALPLVDGVQAMAVYYGVKRNATADYNVDTYVTWDQMQGNDYFTITRCGSC